MTTFNEVIHSGQTVLVDFFAEWCGPCKMMGPILKELKSQVGDDVKIIKVDIDKQPQIASIYRISGVPTLMIFRDGQVIWRQSGVIPAHQLRSVLEQVGKSVNH
ncbi:MAG TPA: thioredoxin [Chitinophagaceae bacterium]|nr:thioredoxin [Chitinophagaceae bacterium]